MARFSCPHCNQRFEVEQPTAGLTVVCPGCEQPVELPADSAAATTPPAVGAEPYVPLDFLAGDEAPPRDQRVAPPTRPLIQQPPLFQQPNVQPLSRAERQRRRQIRSVALMIVGLVVLIVTAIVLSKL